jgi:hypothetical protein
VDILETTGSLEETKKNLNWSEFWRLWKKLIRTEQSIPIRTPRGLGFFVSDS